jgi:hypothetical protein
MGSGCVLLFDQALRGHVLADICFNIQATFLLVVRPLACHLNIALMRLNRCNSDKLNTCVASYYWDKLALKAWA